MPREFYTYILTNQVRGALYVGMTGNLARRIMQHREGTASAFTRRYRIRRLVRVEPFATAAEAIAREKALKKWNRPWKLKLIERDNPEWRDLFEDFNR